MLWSIGKVIAGIFGVGAGVFSAIAAAGVAGDGLTEALGETEGSGSSVTPAKQPHRMAS